MSDPRRSITRRPAPRGWRLGTTVVLLVLAAWTPASPAADAAVPANVQATLTARILEYDRALKSWAGPGLTVGLVGKSAGSTGDYGRALAGQDAQGVPIKTLPFAFKDAESLRGWIAQNGVRLVYVAPDVGSDAEKVLAAADRLPTVVATREQFQRGAAVGLVVADGKPHILVNLTAAKAARMDLDPKLLQLSEVVR